MIHPKSSVRWNQSIFNYFLVIAVGASPGIPAIRLMALGREAATPPNWQQVFLTGGTAASPSLSDRKRSNENCCCGIPENFPLLI